MKKISTYCFLTLLVLIACNTWAYAPTDCIKCHKLGSPESSLHISVEEFEASVHSAEATCQDCHTGVIDDKHKTIKGSGAVDCSTCHEQENRHALQVTAEYQPKCYSCHTKHATIKKDNETSSVHPKQLTRTCKSCHPVECGETDYLSRLPSLQIASHNKQDFSQSYEKDNCLGCHQGRAAHGEEKPLNSQTCYKCHLSPKGESALWGYIHPRADSQKQPTIFAAAAVYQFFLVLLIWGGIRFYIRKFSHKTRRPGR